MAQGLEKLYYTLNQFTNNSITNGTSQTIQFNTPASDGTYYLKAKSGRSFDGSQENKAALIDNSFTLFNNIIGIISSGMAKLLKNKACYYSIGEYIYNGSYGTVSVANSIADFSQGNKNGYLLTKDIIYFVYGKSDGIKSLLENCAGKAIKEGFFKTYLVFFDIITKLESVFNSSAFLTDWIMYEKNIEFLFFKKWKQYHSLLKRNLDNGFKLRIWKL